jgi:hypothetical protein
VGLADVIERDFPVTTGVGEDDRIGDISDELAELEGAGI